MSFVLDNSVAMAWCFEDEQTPAAMALLDRLVQSGACAPSIWPLEALNALLTAQRRGRLAPDRRRAMASFLRALLVDIDPETPSSAWEAASGLAERFRLSVYDACYLELAQRRRLPLATLDRALRDAATGLGVALLPP